jgi:hypothetical protein
MRSKSILASVLITISAATGISQANRPNETASTAPIVGIWRCEMDGLPAVTLNVTDESGSLKGAVLFYLHRRNPGQPVTATPGVPEPLFDPKFDGKVLRFQVSHRRAHPPGSLQDVPVSFELKLNDDGKAELVNQSEPDLNMPVFIFARSAY